MADLESALLSALMGYARLRLDQLVTTLGADAQSMLPALLAAPPSQLQKDNLAPVAGAVATDLATAKSHATALATLLGGPPQNLAQAQAAFSELAAAVTAVHDAVVAIRGVVPEVGDAEQAVVNLVKQAMGAVGDGVSGFIKQLGVGDAATSVSAGLSARGQSITYQLANAASRSVAGLPGTQLSLSATTLGVVLDYGAGSLGLTLNTGLGVGLVADGFVQALFGGSAGSATVTVTIGLDTAKGLSFQAGVKHRIDLPGSLSVPGIVLRSLGIEIPGDAGAPLAFDITGTIAGSLGPIAAVVQGAGVRLTIDPAQLLGGGGQPAQLALLPPSGAGLTVDAGLVGGGGFLTSKNGEYGGALDLKLGPIEIKAVGLLGTDPFSLVLVLSVTFTPPIQLSFGFTLNTVGGLLALERTVATDALRQGIRDHTTDTLLFPKDPVASAPTILDLLRTIFPTRPGGFVVGPLLELGWGAPVSFVTARLGVIIVVPDPKVILMGSLRVALPLPDAAIVDLRAELYGEITPDHLLFLVSLSGSKVAGFSLAGDFGVLIGFGRDPDFAFSAGGFHPAYPPPGELAGMRRVSVDLSPPAFITMRAEAYLALTTNSFQLGCRVEVRAEVAGVGAEGHLQFDALVLWAPRFSFQIDLSAGVSLFAFGESFASADLHLHLEGPGPWLAHGSASLSFLFFDVDFDLPTISWGDADNPPPDPKSLQKLVQEALSLAGAWAARLPPDTDHLVRLVDLGPHPAVVVVHPLGALEARQQAAPLETTIDRVGRNPVTEKRVNLGSPTIGANPALPVKAVSSTQDLFAPGAYLDLTSDQKLSRPGFEPFPSGLVMAGADTDQFGAASAVSYQWDTVFPTDPVSGLKRARLRMPFTALSGSHGAILRAGPAGSSATANHNPYVVAAQPVTMAHHGAATVRSVRDLSIVAGAPAGPLTTTEAARLVEGLGKDAAQYVGAGVGV